jgi:cell division protein FtsB
MCDFPPVPALFSCSLQFLYLFTLQRIDEAMSSLFEAFSQQAAHVQAEVTALRAEVTALRAEVTNLKQAIVQILHDTSKTAEEKVQAIAAVLQNAASPSS